MVDQNPLTLSLAALITCFLVGPGRGICFEELLTMPGGDVAPLNAAPVALALAIFGISVVFVYVLIVLACVGLLQMLGAASKGRTLSTLVIVFVARRLLEGGLATTIAALTALGWVTG